MKFKEVLVNRKDYNIAAISWTYVPNRDISESNFIIRISLSGIKEGPFQVVGEVPATDVYFEYPTFFRKWQYYYYKLEIIGEDSVYDSRIVELSEHIDPYVKKIRKKYDLYLSHRVKNPVRIYKKKKIGHKCKYCWDPEKDEFVKSHCRVCFGTGYGDDNVFGASDLKVDGWLKKNHMGNLEFFRYDWTFEPYPAINSNIDFGLYTNDEFRIENNGSPLLSLNILGSRDNSIYLDYNPNFINYLEGNTFSIYGLEKKQEFDINNRLVYDPLLDNHRLYLKGLNFLNLDFDKIYFNEISGNGYSILEKKEKYVSFKTVPFPTIQGNDKIFFTKSDGTVTFSYDVDNWFISYISSENNFVISLILGTNVLEVGDRIYMDYFFNGEKEIIVEGKTKKIAYSSEQKKSLAYFTVTNVETNEVNLKVETLSEYLPLVENIMNNLFVDGYKIMSFASSGLNVSVYRTEDRYAMFRSYRKLEPNTVYKIEHKNIKKDAFEGCGLLLIDIVEGIVYRGPTWDGKQYLDDGDFYVNPEMTEFNTLDLEEKIYEVTYIYKLKDLSFNSYFVPKNFKFIKDKLITDTWIFKHPNLKNKENLVGKKLTVSEKDIYEEFDITAYNKEFGVIECQNTLLDANDLYNNLTEKAIFNVIYPNTGGFYSAIKSWINYMNPLSKMEMLREDGSSSDVVFNSITYFYPRIEPDDLIFDEKTKLFYNVEQVNTPYFRRAELYQIMSIKEVPGVEQDELYKLLNR